MNKNTTIMETNKPDNRKDAQLRNLFAASKITAGENLKYRIMQQLQTESMLLLRPIQVKERKTNRQIVNLLVIAGIAYLLIAIVIGFFYMSFETGIFSLPEFYLTILFIIGVSSVFGLISYYDEKLRTNVKLK
jgi:membrane-associated HD superfamily phosphohydrolase